MDFQELEKHCWAFLEDVDSVFGVYLDATVGFDLLYHYYYEQQILPNALQAIQANPAFSSVEEYLASVDMYLGEGDPNTPEAEQLHQISQLRFGLRNKTGGDNWIFIANLCLVSIYQFWEDHYRKRIAKA